MFSKRGIDVGTKLTPASVVLILLQGAGRPSIEDNLELVLRLAIEMKGSYERRKRAFFSFGLEESIAVVRSIFNWGFPRNIQAGQGSASFKKKVPVDNDTWHIISRLLY